MKEAPIQRAILQALTAKRVWCWRVNSGMLPLQDKRYGQRMVKLAPNGTPDILGVLPGGKLFGLEVKTDTGKQSASQREWQERAESNGVRYAVVRSIREALKTIDVWTGEIT